MYAHLFDILASSMTFDVVPSSVFTNGSSGFLLGSVKSLVFRVLSLSLFFFTCQISIFLHPILWYQYFFLLFLSLFTLCCSLTWATIYIPHIPPQIEIKTLLNHIFIYTQAQDKFRTLHFFVTWTLVV